MNLPNKLTVLRIILVPIFLVALMWDFPHHYLVADLLFVAASLTDLLDGKIARKHNLITDLGKFLDPLADKMLTTAAFLGFMACSIGSRFGGAMTDMLMWVNFIVLTREFMVTSVRLMAAGGGKVVAANIYGKLKTVFQMTAIITAMAFEWFIELLSAFITLPTIICDIMVITYTALIWISTVMAVISGVIYVWQNKEYIKTK